MYDNIEGAVHVLSSTHDNYLLEEIITSLHQIGDPNNRLCNIA